ncbi:DHHA1 domain-containing protein [Halorussus gelatinilyticus]|uniref:DHHA1 domain-containing protein n=1 Tax=Halorussus gelatinilyticus TaxID=2937524 RepID=A0A8U0IHW9_9EURY|nr:DHHA1 domain-containing protein [Halorussus gelatinilyticus]UPW00593.1 DHHA1 domain-containing protein [Halorussus gelatinilyticus]
MSQLAAREPEVRSFEATVAAVDGREVTLDESHFYAESGGQPADRGTLGGVPVEDVQRRDGEIVHRLADPAAESGIAVGETVRGEIDDAFRTYCMRAHTASHLLYGAGREVLDDLGYGGFDIGERKVRVDFTTSTDVTDETLAELERLTNRAIWDSLAVSWEEISEAEARERDEIAFNTKTEEGVMSESDAVRVVTVEGFDWAACGGTHVGDTSEIGPVTVLDRSNPGEGLTRVEFAVGPTAIRRRADDVRSAREAARTLDVGVSELPEAAERVSQQVEELEADLADAKAELLDARLADLRERPVERDGGEWVVGTVSAFGPNEVADRARELASGETAANSPDAVVLVGSDGATFVVAATEGDPDAGDVVDEVTSEFGGGGGGSPTVAQGGGLDASPEEVVSYLRNR